MHGQQNIKIRKYNPYIHRREYIICFMWLWN